MAKRYRALVAFDCPADPDSFKANQAARQAEGEERDSLVAQVKWMHVKEGQEVTPYSAAIEKSWLENEVVEEVSERG